MLWYCFRGKMWREEIEGKSMKLHLENRNTIKILKSFCLSSKPKEDTTAIKLLKVSKSIRVQRESSCSDIMEIPRMKLPCAAKYIPGRQKNSSILVDPEGFRMAFKKKEPSGLLYYACADKSCNVRVTVKKEVVGVGEEEVAMVVGFRGEHNHDNSLLQDKVNMVVQRVLQLCHGCLREEQVGRSGLAILYLLYLLVE